MNLNVNLSPDARIDLIEIQDFIAQDNVFAAEKVIDKIFSAFELLENYPLTGHKRDDLTDRNVRFWKVYNYLIIYEASAKPIYIVRVLSGFRNIQTLLT